MSFVCLSFVSFSLIVLSRTSDLYVNLQKSVYCLKICLAFLYFCCLLLSLLLFMSAIYSSPFVFFFFFSDLFLSLLLFAMFPPLCAAQCFSLLLSLSLFFLLIPPCVISKNYNFYVFPVYRQTSLITRSYISI